MGKLIDYESLARYELGVDGTTAGGVKSRIAVVILKVVKVVLILSVDLALVVETRHDHHQKRQNLSSREIGFFSKVYTLYNILVRIEDATNNNLETA